MLLQKTKYTRYPKGKYAKHERSDKFDAMKEELMEFLKKDLGLAEDRKPS